MRFIVVSWPAHQQEDARRPKLVGTQAVPFLLGADQLRDEIVPGVAPPVGEVADHVHGAFRGDLVDQVRDDPLDPRPEALDDSRSERLVHERPQPSVIRGVDEQHDVVETALTQTDRLALQSLGQRGCVLGIDAEARVTQHLERVPVARDEPEPEGTLVHWVALPQSAREGPGIGLDLFEIGVEQRRLDGPRLVQIHRISHRAKHIRPPRGHRFLPQMVARRCRPMGS
jgi:hypothetical protein